MKIRRAFVAGSFYPNESEEIKRMFEYYNKILDENIKDRSVFQLNPKIIIVPHAGYVYSAFTANVAYKIASSTNYKRAVVIGPSHKVYIEGVSVGVYEEYETPFGFLKSDEMIVKNLQDKFGVNFVPSAHKEHSTEVQMPFLKYYFKDIEVVELIYGRESAFHLKEIVEYLFKEEDTLVVISSDLSHYHDIQKANELDAICIDAVRSLDSKKLAEGCEACGKVGMESAIIYAKEKNLKSILLDYRTSADANRDKTSVVGYMSAALVL